MMKMEERNEDKNVIESLILILSTGRMIFKHSRRSMNLKVNKNQWGKKRTEMILQAWNILTNGSYIIYFPTLMMSQSYPQPVMLSPLKTSESQPTTTSSLWIFPYILYLTKNNNNKTQTKKTRPLEIFISQMKNFCLKISTFQKDVFIKQETWRLNKKVY